MIDAAQCLARSKSLYELARICSTDKLRIETLDVAAYWKRLSVTAIYQDKIELSIATSNLEYTVPEN